MKTFFEHNMKNWLTHVTMAFFVSDEVSTSSFMRDDGFAIFKRQKPNGVKRSAQPVRKTPTFWLICMVFTGRPAPKINFNPRDIGPQLSHQVTSIIVQPVSGRCINFHQTRTNTEKPGLVKPPTPKSKWSTIWSTIINLFILSSWPHQLDTYVSRFLDRNHSHPCFFYRFPSQQAIDFHPSRWHLASSGHHEGSGLSSAPRANILALQQPHWKRRFDPKGILHWNPLISKNQFS